MASRIASASVVEGCSASGGGCRGRFWPWIRRRRRLLIGGTHQDQAMDRLEPPALADQLAGQEVEEFGVGGSLALGAEVAGSGDQPSAEVVLPEPVDDHPSEQVAGSSVEVGEPLRQRGPAVRQLRASEAATCQRFSPSEALVSTWRNPEVDLALLLGEVASLEEIGFLEEVSPLRVQAERLGRLRWRSGPWSTRASGPWPRSPSPSRSRATDLGVELAEVVEERGPLLGRPASAESSGRLRA